MKRQILMQTLVSRDKFSLLGMIYLKLSCSVLTAIFSVKGKLVTS
jgi:hypothetical protein